MSSVEISYEGSNAILTLNRGKVNALNEDVLDDIRGRFEELAGNDSIQAIVLTGNGSFFSFGFDIPGLYDHSRKAFTGFVTKFTDLYKFIFLYPKPVVAAINGHAVAGGCMLATACDYRLMVSGKAKISLNEITFGSTVFQAGVEILRYWVGSQIAQNILIEGAMYSAEEAKNLGLIHEVVSPDDLREKATEVARRLGAKNGSAFAHMKNMLRLPVVAQVSAMDRETIREFVDIWYSGELRERLRQITIRE